MELHLKVKFCIISLVLLWTDACEDRARSMCAYFASNPEACETGSWSDFGKSRCQKTCNLCPEEIIEENTENANNENNAAPVTSVDARKEDRCMGPIKCSFMKVCVGWEGNKAYCYGKDDWCKYASNDCQTDADCQKYTTSSPKYEKYKDVTCSAPDDWEQAACTCDASDKKCNGPIKCGTSGMCVGFEGDKVYCYGKFSSCKINTCTSDEDCSKYSTDSPKWTSGKAVTCTEPLKSWTKDACSCGACLDDANFYRKRHPGTPLFQYRWVTTSHAQTRADDLLNNPGQLSVLGSDWRNIQEDGEGENTYNDPLAKSVDKVAACKKANAKWYDEFLDWDFATASDKVDGYGDPLGPTGHMTQMLWKESTSVGYWVVKTSRGVLTVARYNPAGNFAGRYAENVLEAGPGLLPEADEEEAFDTGAEDKELKEAERDFIEPERA